MRSHELDSFQIGLQIFNSFLQKWVTPFELIAAYHLPNYVIHRRRNVRMRVVN